MRGDVADRGLARRGARRRSAATSRRCAASFMRRRRSATRWPPRSTESASRASCDPSSAARSRSIALTRDDPIELFLLFSSATTLLGAPGQGVYVAANLALEAMARQRRAEGRPALAVAWGPIEDAGYLAERPEARDALARRLGAKPMPAAQALAGAPGDRSPADCRRPALPRRAGTRRGAFCRSSPRRCFAEIRADGGCFAGRRFAGRAARRARRRRWRWRSSRPSSPKRPRHILRLPAAGDRSGCGRCREMGMDSLMAVELRLALESRLRIDLPLVSLAEGTSVASIAARLGERRFAPGRTDAEVIALGRRVTRYRRRGRRRGADAAETDRVVEPARGKIGCGGVIRWQPGRNLFGLSAQAKARLIEKLASAAASPRSPHRREPAAAPARRAARLDVAQLEGYPRNPHDRARRRNYLGIADPFFRVHEGIAGAETVIDGRTYINFASYNYLGLNGDPAHRRRGQGGDRPLRHLGLGEPSGFRRAAGPPRARTGAGPPPRCRGQRRPGRRTFDQRHRDRPSARPQRRDRPRRADPQQHRAGGDAVGGAPRAVPPISTRRPPTGCSPKRGRATAMRCWSSRGITAWTATSPISPAFIAAARRHRAWLMVDEAHALGVLGPRGFGSADHFGIDPDEVDIWMGTLSKSLVSCGGYIAGRRDLDRLSEAGRRPVSCSRSAWRRRRRRRRSRRSQLLEREPERVRRLNDRAALFLRLAREGGLDVGGSVGASIVPIITGSSIRRRPAGAGDVPPRHQRPADPLSGGARARRPAAVLSDRRSTARRRSATRSRILLEESRGGRRRADRSRRRCPAPRHGNAVALKLPGLRLRHRRARLDRCGSTAGARCSFGDKAARPRQNGRPSAAAASRPGARSCASRRGEAARRIIEDRRRQPGPSSGSKYSGTAPPVSRNAGISLHRAGTPSASASTSGKPKPSAKDGSSSARAPFSSRTISASGRWLCSTRSPRSAGQRSSMSMMFSVSQPRRPISTRGAAPAAALRRRSGARN